MNDGSTNELLGEMVETLKKLLGRLEPWKMTTDAPAPSPQTIGQRIAERLIRKSGDRVINFYPQGGPAWSLGIPPPYNLGGAAEDLQKNIAAAIDKAVADDRAAADDINAAGIAAEREACAKTADEFSREYATYSDSDDLCRAARAVAAAIRSRQ